jgi:hypothetical protein
VLKEVRELKEDRVLRVHGVRKVLRVYKGPKVLRVLKGT